MVRASNAEELALIAQEIGAEVVRGPVKYPGREGGFDVGDTDLEEILYELKDQEVVLIIAPLGPTEEFRRSGKAASSLTFSILSLKAHSCPAKEEPWQ